MKRKRSEPCSTAALEDLGLRVLRSGKEFNPHALAPDVIVQNIDAFAMFSSAHTAQEEALSSLETEGDPADTDEPTPRTPASYLPPSLGEVSFVPLSNLLVAARESSKRQKPDPSRYDGLSAREKKKLKSKESWREKRAQEREEALAASGSVVKAHVQRRLDSATVLIINGLTLPFRQNAWTGQRAAAPSIRILATPDVFKISGLTLVKRDCESQTQVIRTSEGYRPDWADLMEHFDELMEWMYRSLILPDALKHHRRGDCSTIGVGYGFGGGRVRPGVYAHSKRNSVVIKAVLEKLNHSTNCSLQGLLSLFPKLHALYTNLDKNIVDVDNPNIKRSFQNCCYPACHFNLHKAGAVIHCDFWNWLFSMCSIFNGGKFNHKGGGHFIAWSLGLAVEFPPGSSLYIPSAAIPHSNSSVAAHERRHSMAFFLPAGLVRYYHNGFRSDKEFRELANPKQLGAWVDYRKNMWKTGLELLQYG
ncbi:hypothetical protein BDP27DRAFT_1337259 [Rhodocollybia butyracea]|uniref:Uncharacterized protein n=1 Tax=Rhodocollybia butyracea TaxID=206335 RepID=A0A9P5PDQ6_9AGAR|nr:hypothetical protein BDP27DRAFT_1337259 [Rhodocollybia butyracea]